MAHARRSTTPLAAPIDLSRLSPSTLVRLPLGPLDTADTFAQRLEGCRDLGSVYELVKEAATLTTGRSRGGLMLALADLGNHPQGWFGAFYPVASNIIVMNEVPMERVRQTDPALWPLYAFHVLLHEYVHALGVTDEAQCRIEVRHICARLFRPDHLIHAMTEDMQRFFPKIVFPHQAWKPRALDLRLVRDFDRSGTTYIR